MKEIFEELLPKYIEELEKLFSKYRNVTIEAKTYLNNRGGKGSISFQVIIKN
ncbi:hypothetical protein [Flavobacterium branchiophilum]|uniref:hypothetical protein n=1 Tax=Flavobacterium branchiophilum TaxID=55197 RepID=UPI001E602DCB|nr:hypothetical protein [Flavobacterium branchiophilum]